MFQVLKRGVTNSHTTVNVPLGIRHEQEVNPRSLGTSYRQCLLRVS